MTPEIDKQLASLIEAAKQAGSDAASFIQQQAPEVVEQLLRWQAVKSGCVAAFFAALTILFVKYAINRSKDEDEYSFEPPWQVVAVFAGILALGSAAGVLGVLKVFIAPNLVIIEKISDILK